MQSNEALTPIELIGPWKQGYALSLHTSSSTPVKDSAGNVLHWETVRPPLADALYKLKYRHDMRKAATISRAVVEFLRHMSNEWNIDYIVPISPPIWKRLFHPLLALSRQISKESKIPLNSSSLHKRFFSSAVKGIDDPITRQQLLADAFYIRRASLRKNTLKGKTVLLFDDLYRSGATLSAAGDILRRSAQVADIYVLTVTKSRTKR